MLTNWDRKVWWGKDLSFPGVPQASPDTIDVISRSSVKTDPQHPQHTALTYHSLLALRHLGLTKT